MTETGNSTVTTEYAGNYIYKDNSLQFFNHTEGYVEPDGSNGYNYIYQYKDHLGNIRLSYTDADGNGSINASTEIVEENNYYPFGLKHKGYNNIQSRRDHLYGFGGKEEQEELGLNWHDFGWRNYDDAIGRWLNLDPLAEEYFNLTPYNYVSNTPLQAIDPNGMEIIIIGNEKYVQAVINYLVSLGSKSEKGAQLVLDAINSKDQFVIFDPKQKELHGELKNNEKLKEGYETLAFDVDQADGEYKPENGTGKNKLIKTGETSLAHELSHFNSDNNEIAYVSGTKIGVDEVNAVKEENQVRREMELPERTHYMNVNVYGKKVKDRKFVEDKDYSVNIPGIGKASFNGAYKYFTKKEYQNLNTKYYHNFSKIKNRLKYPTPRKQLVLSNKYKSK